VFGRRRISLFKSAHCKTGLGPSLGFSFKLISITFSDEIPLSQNILEHSLQNVFPSKHRMNVLHLTKYLREFNSFSLQADIILFAAILLVTPDCLNRARA
jgi:hypothetical protein